MAYLVTYEYKAGGGLLADAADLQCVMQRSLTFLSCSIFDFEFYVLSGSLIADFSPELSSLYALSPSLSPVCPHLYNPPVPPIGCFVHLWTLKFLAS